MKDTYHFCGPQKSTCDRDPAEKSEWDKGFLHYYQHGDHVSFWDVDYFCCIAKPGEKPQEWPEPTSWDEVKSFSGSPGRWVEAESNSFQVGGTETRTKKNGGAICTYTVWKDVCGVEHSNDDEQCPEDEETGAIPVADGASGSCNSGWDCPSGQMYRASTSSCATPCSEGYAFESTTSNNCVECSETETQGIAGDNGTGTNGTLPDAMHRICVKCTASTHFFDAKTRTCVEKTQMRALSRTELQYGIGSYTQGANKVSDQCWTKFDTDYKKCVLKTSN